MNKKRENNISKNQQEIYQIHDKFFKLTFADFGVKESFLQTYLPAELVKDIDLNAVEEVNPNFISNTFKLEESDLLMKTYLKKDRKKPIYILALMEHKSYKDRKTPFQILRYLIDIWQSQINKNDALSPILPIVIYEGTNSWNYLQLKDYFKHIDPKWQVFLPIYQSLFYDFSLNTTIKQLPENVSLRTYLEVIQTIGIKDTQQFIRRVIEIAELVYSYHGEENMEQFIKIFKRVSIYIENTRKDKKPLIDILKGEESMIVSSIEKWENEAIERGIEQGIRLGEERGIEQGIRQNAKRMKTKGFSIEDIIDITGLSRDEIERL